MRKVVLMLIPGIVLILIACQRERTTVQEMILNENWEFRAVDDPADAWLPATVPGSVHMDLLANGKIEDPFYRMNERDLQWIDKKDWVYRTTFTVPKKLFFKDQIDIDFEGLDTYAEVFLNQNKILETDNMFRRWHADIKAYLKDGENVLEVFFRSPVAVGLEKYNEQGYVIPVSDNDQSEVGGLGDKKVSIYTRKAGYHYGWDWGPRFVTSGIWRPIRLHAYDGGIIQSVDIQEIELTAESASLIAVAEVEARFPTEADVSIRVNGQLSRRQLVELEPGDNVVSVGFTIDDPQLWWPNGLGEQYLYDLEVIIADRGERLYSKKSMRYGLRTIEVVQQADDKGETFYFKVNGRPVFMKGANYIPQDNFLSRVTPERYEHILQSAKDANMNMIRIWGGGIYEDDLFYELCDEKGLLVWQDFMFACAMFPGDDAFLENVRREAIDNIKRLRNHPSLALWCGNNENLSAWYNWGWSKQVAEQQGQDVADAIWHAYDTLFHKILPQTVEAYDPGRFYWSSSPQGGTGIPENWIAGDVHYWGVWWGQEPFSRYEELIPRFMSEFGFQSFPELSTVEKFAEPEDYDIYSDVMKAHQRSSIGNGTIANYMDRDYRAPKDFESFLYVGQVLQAEGIRTGIEAHRRNMPYCMGSLYWQIDDCWPVASWSSIDYYGNWKALHYFAKKAFTNVLVSPKIEDDRLEVYVVSDRSDAVPAEMVLRLLDFDGNVLWEHSNELTIAANSSDKYFGLPLQELLGNAPRNRVLLEAVINADGQHLSSNLLYFVPPKELDLPSPTVETQVEAVAGGYRLLLRTDKLAKNAYLTLPGTDGFFTDNYLDLLPGETVEIVFRTKEKVEDLEGKLVVRTLRDSFTS